MISRFYEAAKKAFDALGGKPIPKVAQLSQEYAALLAEKQEQYAPVGIGVDGYLVQIVGAPPLEGHQLPDGGKVNLEHIAA